ncbi:hypothetical protein V6N12_001805 [Hibiscus sabdariffa]|uniref:Uncharacterized protein n=1 Tax=Hibiscus sabdariffa TaxID=183260 RepID=A0ABR2BRG1_9ROSI
MKGMVGSGLCYVGTPWCVKQKGPIFTPLVQIFVAIFDFSILHGEIYFVSGLCILLWGRNCEAEEIQQLKLTQVEDDCNARPQVQPMSVFPVQQARIRINAPPVLQELMLSQKQ